MLFENLVSLIDGKLLNEPSISSFSQIVFDPKKVKIGDLYFGDKKGIKEALKNGAYGIVSDKLNVEDSEIAWIEIKDLYKAKLKFLRYLVLKNNTYVLSLNSVEIDIANNIVVNVKDIFYIKKDELDEVIKILYLSNHTYRLIVFEKELFNDIELTEYSVFVNNNIIVQKYTIFLMSFIYKNYLYKDIKIPKIFKNELEKILNIFDDIDIEYSISKLNFISHFKPLFLDRNYKLLPFGQSRKVVILESDKDLLKREISFIKENASWAKMILLLPKDFKFSYDKELTIEYFKNYADIKKKKIFYYNFIVMLDFEYGFEKYLLRSNTNIKNSLF